MLQSVNTTQTFARAHTEQDPGIGRAGGLDQPGRRIVDLVDVGDAVAVRIDLARVPKAVEVLVVLDDGRRRIRHRRERRAGHRDDGRDRRPCHDLAVGQCTSAQRSPRQWISGAQIKVFARAFLAFGAAPVLK